MTTTITVNVGGDYVAEVKGTGAGGHTINEQVQGGTSKNIPVGGHPAHVAFTITEREMTAAEKEARKPPPANLSGTITN